ncbi:hypothetical protein E2C01_100101 [Portunus trituberculatus]|uniref:Uncharacterized protein n=1 Tax=Portunus trituberculatus TaxID=210409 RepID=A0A5B7KIJ0_PORTR|nr:hypothetical protein [Portunus trituberculatus]
MLYLPCFASQHPALSLTVPACPMSPHPGSHTATSPHLHTSTPLQCKGQPHIQESKLQSMYGGGIPSLTRICQVKLRSRPARTLLVEK